MYVKTEAIVLSHKKIRDNVTLLSLYTREMGRASFLFYGSGGKHGGRAYSMLQPLSLVEIETDLRNAKELQVVKEMKCLHPLHDAMFDPYKSSILFFLAEVLSNALRTNESDELLFRFLTESVLTLNEMDSSVCNFHIAFLVRLSAFLGFGPNVCDLSGARYFDLVQAEYTDQHPSHTQFVGDSDARFLQSLCRMNYRNLNRFRFSKRERNELLDHIIDYHRIHLQGFGDLKTLSVLHEVFD